MERKEGRKEGRKGGSGTQAGVLASPVWFGFVYGSSRKQLGLIGFAKSSP
jgi:hypothetical protein